MSYTKDMKNTLIIAVICVAVIAGGAWLYFHTQKAPVPTSTAAGTEQKTTTVAFKVLDQGETAKAVTQRKNYAIYDVAGFARFWKESRGSGTPPIVDFSKYDVIGVFAGTQPSSGYSIAVDKVLDTDGTRSVAVRITAPDESCTVVEEPTSPYQFVLVPHSDAQALSHTDIVVKKGCSQ